MKFEELLDKACTAAQLPTMGKEQLPSALPKETKEILIKLPPEEVGKVLSQAINKVNHGSVDSIDKLVREQVCK